MRLQGYEFRIAAYCGTQFGFFFCECNKISKISSFTEDAPKRHPLERWVLLIPHRHHEALHDAYDSWFCRARSTLNKSKGLLHYQYGFGVLLIATAWVNVLATTVMFLSLSSDLLTYPLIGYSSEPKMCHKQFEDKKSTGAVWVRGVTQIISVGISPIFEVFSGTNINTFRGQIWQTLLHFIMIWALLPSILTCE